MNTLTDKAQSALARGNWEYAMDLYEAALAETPDDLTTRRALRETQIRQARTRPPTWAVPLPAWRLLGNHSKWSVRDPSRALVHSERMLRQDPFHPRFIKAHVDAALAAHLKQVAMDSLEILIHHDPRPVAALEILRDIRRADGDLMGEYTCLSALRKLKPQQKGLDRELKNVAGRLALENESWSGNPPLPHEPDGQADEPVV